MTNELIDFERDCEINGFPVLNNATMVCLLNDKYLYSDDETYTLEQLFDIEEQHNGWDWDIEEYDDEFYGNIPQDYLTLEDIEEGRLI